MTSIVVIVLLSWVIIAVRGQDLASDTRALLAFSAVHDPRGTKLHWRNSTWTCRWRGVTCSSSGRVTELRLPGKGFRGELPGESLSSLTDLRVVSLRGNKLTGVFPGELGKCGSLEGVFLAGNEFSGALPEDLGALWPQLTHLSLEYNRLNGTVPTSLASSPNLYLLNLRNNSFSGELPPFTATNLTVFDVGNNNFSGAVPSSLSRFPPASYAGNSGLCGPPLTSVCRPSPVVVVPSPSPALESKHQQQKLSTGAIAGVVVGAVAILLALGIFCLWRRTRPGDKKVPEREASIKVGGTLSEQGEECSEVERNKLVFFDGKKYSFNLEDLLRASAEVLGKGSVGTAYKAILEDGTVMAVKRLKDVTTAKKEFESQIQVVGKLQHPNLCPLRAYYFSKDEKLLVYDYMPMGSLSALLHGNRGSSRTPLDWVSRVKIALGAGKGLEYLHSNGGPKFVHANIKSSNILLNRELEAYISDFGLAQLLTASSAASRIVGYRAPEVTETKKVTQKSDVYSFGVLLLELLTGKAPTQAALNDEGIDLPRWVQSVVREEWTAEVFDLELMRYNNIEEEMVAMLQIAMQCVDPVPERRPKMNNVLLLLEDVHPFFNEDASRQSESAGSEDHKFKEKLSTSQENTPSHSLTP